MKNYIKSAAHRTGLYSPARQLYRQLSPKLRKERRILLNFFGQFVNAGELCFDIGANVGQTTEILVRLGAKVITLEPNPRCAPTLKWQFGAERNVTIVHKALGTASGYATLNYQGTDSTASIREDWPFEADSTAEVEVTTLDNLILEFGVPKLCKVDVEGYELEVFRGLTQPIPWIYFEAHSHELASARSVLAQLTSIGHILGINMTDSEHGPWLLEKWATAEEFNDRLGGIAPKCGNIVVKMAV